MNKLMNKLTEKYIRPYKVKKIISENVVELELLVSLRIYLVVNVTMLYQEQVEGQKKILPPLVETEGEKEYEVEKILNRQDVRVKLKYLVRWNGYTLEKDIWEGLENLGNAMELVEEFEQEIRKKEIRQVE